MEAVVNRVFSRVWFAGGCSARGYGVTWRRRAVRPRSDSVCTTFFRRRRRADKKQGIVRRSAMPHLANALSQRGCETHFGKGSRMWGLFEACARTPGRQCQEDEKRSGPGVARVMLLVAARKSARTSPRVAEGDADKDAPLQILVRSPAKRRGCGTGGGPVARRTSKGRCTRVLSRIVHMNILVVVWIRRRSCAAQVALTCPAHVLEAGLFRRFQIWLSSAFFGPVLGSFSPDLTKFGTA